MRTPANLVALALCVVACVHVDLPAVDSALEAGVLTVDGRERTFLGFVAGPGAPLVISLHGRGGTSKGQERLASLMPLARRERFSLVVPDGHRRSWNDARGFGPAAEDGIDDVKFVSALIDEFTVRRGADPKRVYVLGMSNGGFMTLTLACRLSERLAGVASITGAVSKPLAADCPMTKPVPVALFMGDEDPLVPFGGGPVAKDRGEALSAEDSARFFAKKNGCGDEVATSQLPDLDPGDGTRIELSKYEAGCAAPVHLFVVRGGGHAWPGGWPYLGERFIGRTSRDLSASEAAWAFFKVNGAR